LELQPKIFSAYVRSGQPQLDGSARGAGLGLAVCKKLAELNGGRVGYESEQGKGARFWTEIPLITGFGPDDSPGESRKLDFSQVRTLVVDDDPMQRETMSLLLQEMEVVPELAATAEAALGLLRSAQFDLVLADYALGPRSGVDLLREVRSTSEKTSLLPVFYLITGFAAENIKESAMHAGFAGVHRKHLNLSGTYEILASVQEARRRS